MSGRAYLLRRKETYLQRDHACDSWPGSHLAASVIVGHRRDVKRMDPGLMVSSIVCGCRFARECWTVLAIPREETQPDMLVPGARAKNW